MDDQRWLAASHFDVDVVEAARDLIGRTLAVTAGSSTIEALIVEAEAYGGINDPASHAAFRPGGRAAAMFGPPGTIYVYAAYGMYPCLNIVTDAPGNPSAVLIRGIWRAQEPKPVLGPGRATRMLGVTLGHHGSCVEDGPIRVSRERAELDIVASPRVGIRRGVEFPWRFIDARAVTGAR